MTRRFFICHLIFCSVLELGVGLSCWGPYLELLEVEMPLQVSQSLIDWKDFKAYQVTCLCGLNFWRLLLVLSRLACGVRKWTASAYGMNSVPQYCGLFKVFFFKLLVLLFILIQFFSFFEVGPTGALFNRKNRTYNFIYKFLLV